MLVVSVNFNLDYSIEIQNLLSSKNMFFFGKNLVHNLLNTYKTHFKPELFWKYGFVVVGCF